MYKRQGTFLDEISHDIPHQNWGEKEWDLDFQHMKRIGTVSYTHLLGICIGQQLMCSHSEESDTDCLGIFDTKVLKFRPEKHEDKGPHMGWNTLTRTSSPLFKGYGDRT